MDSSFTLYNDTIVLFFILLHLCAALMRRPERIAWKTIYFVPSLTIVYPRFSLYRFLFVGYEN